MNFDSWFKPLSVFKPIALSAAIGLGVLAEPAEAGPLIDWLFGRSNNAPAYPVGQPVPLGNAVGNGYAAGYGNGYAAGYGVYPRTAVPQTGYAAPGYAANYGTYYGSQLPVIGNGGAAYTAPVPSGVTAATLPRTLSYVPNYRTNSYRAPVTYYRPVLTTDPNTGSQVVAMAPCSSYEYQTSRVPAPGRTAYYGSSLVPQTQPMQQALPTYTLPSGGVPLASNYPTNTYGSAYGSYSAQQPAVAPSTAYPASPYYGGTYSGGSTGSYLPQTQSVPGLSAPQAPGTIRTPAPTYGQVVPDPSLSQPVMPPPAASGAPSTSPGFGTDPRGDVAPSLPNNSSASRQSLSPKLQSITRNQPSNSNRRMQPIQERSTTYPNYADNSRREPNYPKVEVPSLRSNPFGESRTEVPASTGNTAAPAMDPIPVPDDFKLKPRWNPGLLREEDMTALRPIAPEVAKYAGQSKKIHWASFEETRSVAKPSYDAERLQNQNRLNNQIGTSERNTQVLRSYDLPLEPMSTQPAVRQRANMPAPNSVRKAPAQKPSRYDNRGWKTSR